MREFTDIHAFCSYANGRNAEIEGPKGWFGYAVAYDYLGHAIARCFVQYC